MKKFRQFKESLDRDVSSFSHRRLSTILKNPAHPMHSAAKAEHDRRMQRRESVQEKTLTPAEKKKREEILEELEVDIRSHSNRRLATILKNPSHPRHAEAKAEYDRRKMSNESVEQVAESIEKMSSARLKYHATKKFPHGSFTDKEIKDEHKRRQKSEPNYHTVKPALESVQQVDEAQGTAAKYAGKSGVFGGKYTSTDRMMSMKNFNAIRDKRAKQRDAEHQKQDPKHAAAGYAKHMVDTDKAKKKAAKRGVDASHLNYRHTNGLKQESTQIDEILDTPKAMQSYRDKNKASYDKAANSAAAKMLRNKNGFHSTDTSDELKTMDKRAAGDKMADRNAIRKTFKLLRKGK